MKQAEWQPLEVRIEEKTSQVESFWLKERQEQMNHRFEVASISPQTMKAGAGKRGEYTRVARLTDSWEPVLTAKQLYLPEQGIHVSTSEGPVDIAEAFKEELRRFPIAKSDNLISAGALLFADHGGKRGAQPLVWPLPMSRGGETVAWPGRHLRPVATSGRSSWMTRGVRPNHRHVN